MKVKLDASGRLVDNLIDLKSNKIEFQQCKYILKAKSLLSEEFVFFIELQQQQQVHLSDQLQMSSSAAGGNTSPVVGANWQRHASSSASVTGPSLASASTHSQRQTPVATSYSGLQLQQPTPAAGKVERNGWKFSKTLDLSIHFISAQCNLMIWLVLQRNKISQISR